MGIGYGSLRVFSIFAFFVAFIRSCAPFQALPSFIWSSFNSFCGVFLLINVRKAGFL